ncbi:MAG: hypothetical protein R3Y24_03300 [Eubacteriales bacterium]
MKVNHYKGEHKFSPAASVISHLHASEITGLKYYIWVYILGTIFTFINYMFVQSIYISNILLCVLFSILCYKGISICIHYKQARQKNYFSFGRKEFSEKYKGFRIKVLLFWIAFILLCMIGKFVIQLRYQYFYSCTYFFLLLDRVFVNMGCLLQKFSDPRGKVVLCCCGCPCRGWDLLMIHTPLLFALNSENIIENILIGISSVLAVISMVQWEKEKYSLVEVRKKCANTCNLSLCREHRSDA